MIIFTSWTDSIEVWAFVTALVLSCLHNAHDVCCLLIFAFVAFIRLLAAFTTVFACFILFVIGAPSQLLPPLFGSPPNNIAASNLIPLAPKYPQIPAGPSFPEGSAASTYQLLASNPLGSVPPYQLPLGIIPNGCGMQPVVPGTWRSGGLASKTFICLIPMNLDMCASFALPRKQLCGWSPDSVLF